MELGDEAGAIAAAQYFMELYDYVLATGELSEWEAISGQSCEFCANVREDVEHIYPRGGRFVREDAAYSSFEIAGREEQLGVYGVQLSFELGPASEYGPAGAVEHKLPAESGYLVLDVTPSARGWILLEAMASQESLT